MAISDFNHIKDVLDKLDIERPSRFGYTEAAVNATGAAEITALEGVFVIEDPTQINSIPTPDLIGVDPIIVNIGLRTQAATMPRMAVSHFFGRLSLNLLKVTEKLKFLVDEHLVNRYITPSGDVMEDVTAGYTEDTITLVKHKSPLSASAPVTSSAAISLLAAVYNGNAGVMTGSDKKILDDLKSYIDDLPDEVVLINGDQTIADIKTFSSIPVLPALDPSADNQAVRKASMDSAISLAVSTKIDISSLFVGESLQFLTSYREISPTFPWFCMSKPNQILLLDHYSSDFINYLRSKKVVYDEMGANVSSFAGTWSGSNFTLTNTPENLAVIAALAEEWLFADSPTDGWRILVANGVEYNITGFNVTSRIITVSGSPTGTTIEIYLNRVLGSTISAKHFSWAGLGLYMTGQNKITGLRRRDKMQGHRHQSKINIGAGGDLLGFTGASTTTLADTPNNLFVAVLDPISDTVNGIPRTGPKTQMESDTIHAYIFTGEYTV